MPAPLRTNARLVIGLFLLVLAHGRQHRSLDASGVRQLTICVSSNVDVERLSRLQGQASTEEWTSCALSERRLPVP